MMHRSILAAVAAALVAGTAGANGFLEERPWQHLTPDQRLVKATLLDLRERKKADSFNITQTTNIERQINCNLQASAIGNNANPTHSGVGVGPAGVMDSTIAADSLGNTGEATNSADGNTSFGQLPLLNADATAFGNGGAFESSITDTDIVNTVADAGVINSDLVEGISFRPQPLNSGSSIANQVSGSGVVHGGLTEGLRNEVAANGTLSNNIGAGGHLSNDNALLGGLVQLQDQSNIASPISSEVLDSNIRGTVGDVSANAADIDNILNSEQRNTDTDIRADISSSGACQFGALP